MKIKTTPTEWLIALFDAALETKEECMRMRIRKIGDKLKKKQPELYKELTDHYKAINNRKPEQNESEVADDESEDDYYSSNEELFDQILTNDETVNNGEIVRNGRTRNNGETVNNGPRIQNVVQDHSRPKNIFFKSRQTTASKSQSERNQHTRIASARQNTYDTSETDSDHEPIQYRDRNRQYIAVDTPAELEQGKGRASNSPFRPAQTKSNRNIITTRNEPIYRHPSLIDSPRNFDSSRATNILSRMREIRIETVTQNMKNVLNSFAKYNIQRIGWSEQDRADEVACFFEETALENYFSLSTEDRLYYTRVKNHLIKSLKPIDQKEESLAEFFNCKQQPGESVGKYSNRLLEKIRELTDDNKKAFARSELSIVFRKGLNEIIRDKLTLYKETGYEDLVESAKKLEISSNKTSSSELEPTNAINYKKPVEKFTNNRLNKTNIKSCSLCGQNGHLAETCEKFMIVPRPKPNPFSKPFNNDKNSFKNNFYNKSKNVNEYKQNKDKRSENEYENIVTCSHCKRPGHNHKQCWELHPQLKPAKFIKNYNPNQNRNSKN